MTLLSFPHLESCCRDYYPRPFGLFGKNMRSMDWQNTYLYAVSGRACGFMYVLHVRLLSFWHTTCMITLMFALRLFVPYCDGDAYSMHAQHSSIMVARS